MNESQKTAEQCEARNQTNVTRRDFLGMAVAATCLAGSTLPLARGESKSGVPYHTLGQTGEKVSIIGLGGYQTESVRPAASLYTRSGKVGNRFTSTRSFGMT